MIVNYTPEGWEIIHQRAHGLLAMQLAMHWKAAHRPERWAETLLAIADHDDNQEDWRGRNHLNANGTPMNFDMQEFSFTQMQRVTAMAIHKSHWIALLISRHVSFLYNRMRGEHPELDRFLKEQEALRVRWQKALKVKESDLQYAYDLLQWCDQFSLILCQDQLPTGARALEISKGPDGKRYEVRQRPEQTLSVNPWPFEADAFEISIETVCVSQLTFAEDPELWEAIQAAPLRIKTWRLVR